MYRKHFRSKNKLIYHEGGTQTNEEGLKIETAKRTFLRYKSYKIAKKPPFLVSGRTGKKSAKSIWTVAPHLGPTGSASAVEKEGGTANTPCVSSVVRKEIAAEWGKGGTEFWGKHK